MKFYKHFCRNEMKQMINLNVSEIKFPFKSAVSRWSKSRALMYITQVLLRYSMFILNQREKFSKACRMQ